MNGIHLSSSITAEWHSLVSDAEAQCGFHVDDSLRHYLIITLDHFTTDSQLASVVIAIDFLEGLESFGRIGNSLLRQVGDRCLLLSGLFPEQARKRLVNEEYFVSIGRQAYETIATVSIQAAYHSELFHQLSEEFIHLTQILQAMRKVKHINLS